MTSNKSDKQNNPSPLKDFSKSSVFSDQTLCLHVDKRPKSYVCKNANVLVDKVLIRSQCYSFFGVQIHIFNLKKVKLHMSGDISMICIIASYYQIVILLSYLPVVTKKTCIKSHSLIRAGFSSSHLIFPRQLNLLLFAKFWQEKNLEISVKKAFFSHLYNDRCNRFL